MENKHAVVRTDKLAGTDNRAYLVSVRYQPSETMTAIDNGHVVKLDGLEEGSREVFKGVDVTGSEALNEVVLVASPEIMKDHRKNLDEFENEANDIARGYVLTKGAMFSVTKEALAGEAEPAVDDKIELAAGTKMKATRSEVSGTQIGVIDAVETVGRYTYYVIRVV